MRRLKLIGVGLLLLLLPFIGVCYFLWSETTEPEFEGLRRANEAFNLEEYSLVGELIEPSAYQGHRLSQMYMAYLEAFGLGREINRDEARDWAARFSAGNSRGRFECSIGVDWATGRFGPKSIEEAAYWIRYADRISASDLCIESDEASILSPEQIREISEVIGQ